MQRESFMEERPEVAKHASGVVLEIGFGSGLNLPFYKNVTKFYALDPSVSLHELAKQNIEKVSFLVEHIQASAEKIPLPDSSVDAVVSTWTMCSIPDIDAALGEVRRVLKPEGKFAFIEHGKSPKIFWQTLQNIITPISKLFTGGCNLNREMDKLIAQNGLQIVDLMKFPEKGRPLNFVYKGVAVIKRK
ncbi:MAG: class I SAM-dependent methyltransferase [Candidatus Paceibacterota bacterium]